MEVNNDAVRVIPDDDEVIKNERDKVQNDYVLMLKTAVALAVIRSKPKDVTGEQYAKHLYQELMSSGVKWKSKCNQLEKELLEVNIRHFKAELKTSSQLVTDENFPSCVTPPSSSETVSQQHKNDVCPSSYGIRELSKEMQQQHDFFTSIKALKSFTSYVQNLSNDTVVCNRWKGNDGQAEILRNTKCLFLNVFCRLSSQTSINTEIVEIAVGTIVDLLKTLNNPHYNYEIRRSSCLSSVMDVIKDECIKLATKMQADTVLNKLIGMNNLQDFRCHIVCTLSECEVLIPMLLKQLSNGILAIGYQLNTSSNIFQDEIFHMFENVAYLFRTLEEILLKINDKLLKKKLDSETASQTVLKSHKDQTTSKSLNNILVPDEPMEIESINEIRNFSLGNELKENDEIGRTECLKTMKESLDCKTIFNEIHNEDTNKFYKLLKHKLIDIHKDFERTIVNMKEDQILYSIYMWKIICLLEGLIKVCT